MDPPRQGRRCRGPTQGKPRLFGESFDRIVSRFQSRLLEGDQKIPECSLLIGAYRTPEEFYTPWETVDFQKLSYQLIDQRLSQDTSVELFVIIPHLANRAVWALIESLGDEETRNEELYDDLSPVLHLKRALLETMHSTGNNRLVVMEGDTGTGKSSARRLLIEKYGQRLLWIEATSVWKDNSSALLSTVLHALGVKDIPLNSTDRLARLIARLTESRICLIIDEGHHLGPNCLNTLKTLINQTPGEFMGSRSTMMGRSLSQAKL